MYHVYIIRSGIKGPYKIGVARNVVLRRDQLQTGNPEELFIIAKFAFDTERLAYEMEYKLHDKFKKQRIRGEWFSRWIKLKRADKLFNTDFRKQQRNNLSELKQTI